MSYPDSGWPPAANIEELWQAATEEDNLNNRTINTIKQSKNKTINTFAPSPPLRSARTNHTP